mgnify:FL=1
MKIANEDGNFYTLNFSPGEEIVFQIARFAREKGIKAGHITGLGAASRLTIAYYNLDDKKYEKKEFRENVEICSLNGNIAIGKEGELIIHLHGIFSRRDFTTLGGHIVELVISGAGEIHITAFKGEIRRSYDENTGLNLMQEK